MITGFDLVRAAMAVSGVTANERSVLMVLAVMANDQAQAWPPIAGDTGLTTKCVLSERAVQRAVKQLCALGHLTRLQRRHGVVYTVHPDAPLTPVLQSGVSKTPDTGTPDTEAARPVPQSPKLPRTTNPTKASPSSGKRDRANATSVPADFVPTVADGSITAKVMAGWPPGEIDEQVEAFIDRHSAQGTLSKDWQASWRTWVKNWKKFNGQRTRQSGRSGQPADPLVAAAAERIARQDPRRQAVLV